MTDTECRILKLGLFAPGPIPIKEADSVYCIEHSIWEHYGKGTIAAKKNTFAFSLPPLRLDQSLLNHYHQSFKNVYVNCWKGSQKCRCNVQYCKCCTTLVDYFFVSVQTSEWKLNFEYGVGNA